MHNSATINATRFPFRLHKMLEEACYLGREDLISWLPCGTKFRIADHEEFAKTILSKYCRVAKYKAFLRSLSMYKFQRIPSGPAKGCYSHPHFIRYRMDLAEHINRERIQPLPASQLQVPPCSAIVIPPDEMEPVNRLKNKSNLFNLVDRSYNGTVVSIEEQSIPLDNGRKLEAVAIPVCPILTRPSSDIINEIISTFCVDSPMRTSGDGEDINLSANRSNQDEFGFDELLAFDI